MKKNVFKILTFVLIVALGLLAFTACGAPAEQPEARGYNIPAELNIAVGLYNGNELLGTIAKEDFAGVTQEKITMTTKNSMGTEKTVTYLAYNVAGIVAKKSLTVPAFTAIKTLATDNYINDFNMTDLSGLYITVGFEKDGAFEADADAPRLVTDKNSASSKSVTRLLSKIVLNPVAFGLTVKMTQGTKVNDIAISSEVIPVKHSVTKGEITTDYKGYNLKDIIANMTKIKKDNTVMNLVGDYAKVGFVCSDDETGKNYDARVFTKAEIESAEKYVRLVADGEVTRCFSDFADTEPKTYRNNLKKITSIVVYNADNSVNCTFEFTWSVPTV